PANVKHGTQELLSFILDEGSLFKTNAQFQAITEAQGINLSFFANSREIEIGCTAPENTALNSLALAKETLLNPRFTQETLDYAKNRLMEIVNNEEKSSTEK